MRSSLLVLSGAVVVAACSGSSGSAPNPGVGEGGSSSGGSSGGAAVIAEGFIAATVGSGPSSPATVCNLGSVQSWLDVGTPTTTGIPVTVPDGGTQSGAPVTVSCTVSASGSGFDVNLSIGELGTEGGSVTITSPPGQGAVTLSGAQGITGVFQSSSYGTYQESDCTLAFTYSGSPIQQQPIAAGRIWAHISCPSAQVSGETVVGPDGGTQNIQCDAEADFLFEQCGQ
jgi:hypothetical protein